MVGGAVVPPVVKHTLLSVQNLWTSIALTGSAHGSCTHSAARELAMLVGGQGFTMADGVEEVIINININRGLMDRQDGGEIGITDKETFTEIPDTRMVEEEIMVSMIEGEVINPVTWVFRA